MTDDDWMIAVTVAPASRPVKRLPVILARMDFIDGPATCLRARVMISMASWLGRQVLSSATGSGLWKASAWCCCSLRQQVITCWRNLFSQAWLVSPRSRQ